MSEKKSKKVSLSGNFNTKYTELLNKAKVMETNYESLLNKTYQSLENEQFEFCSKKDMELVMKFIENEAPWKYQEIKYLQLCYEELEKITKDSPNEDMISVSNRVLDTLNMFFQKMEGKGLKVKLNVLTTDEYLLIFDRLHNALQLTNKYRKLIQTIGDKNNSVLLTCRNILIPNLQYKANLKPGERDDVHNFNEEDIRKSILELIDAYYPEKLIEESYKEDRESLLKILNTYFPE